MTTIATKRRMLLTAALAPALLAGGCSGGTRNRGLESVHQPVVSRADYTIDLGTRGGELAYGETDRLAGWLAGLRLGYGDRVSIDDPQHRARASGRIADIVAGYGLLLADAAPVTPTALPPGAVRVVVSRMSASVPGCSDWSRMGGSDINQNTGSNHGCAINTNLAAMVASPADLVRGASGTGSDTGTSFKAIDLYRKATPTGGGGTVAKTVATGGK